MTDRSAGRPASPRLERYLAGLPDGLGSYPQCQAKGSVLRSLLEGTALERAGLPEPLRRRLDDPPIASAALLRAALDASGAREAEVEASTPTTARFRARWT